MCGILGAKNISKDKIKKYLKHLEIRGRDGFKSYKKEITLANTRAVPTTEYETGAGFDAINQQPFYNNKFIIVHNGIISNDKELRNKYKIKTKSNVDSSILPKLFSKVGFEKGIKELEGSFSILAFNKKEKTFYAAKNFTPLFYKIEKSKFLFTSFKEEGTKEFPPYNIVKIDKKGNYKFIDFNSKRNKKVLVICSGGIDSVTTAYLYKYLGYDVSLIHFKYGQAAEKAELFAVKEFSKDLDAELIIYDAKKIFKPFKETSKLLKNNKMKDNQMTDAETTLSYVPNRNMIFGSIAAGIAEMLGCSTIAFGGQQMDSVYPDNNPDFVESLSHTLQYSLNWKSNVKFSAPLIHLIKHEIVALGKKIGVPHKNICSCYYPKLKHGKIIHCKKCGCCQFKHIAFKIVKERKIIDNVNEFINKYCMPFI